jgi:hypothetical protein
MGSRLTEMPPRLFVPTEPAEANRMPISGYHIFLARRFSQEVAKSGLRRTSIDPAGMTRNWAGSGLGALRIRHPSFIARDRNAADPPAR